MKFVYTPFFVQHIKVMHPSMYLVLGHSTDLKRLLVFTEFGRTSFFVFLVTHRHVSSIGALFSHNLIEVISFNESLGRFIILPLLERYKQDILSILSSQLFTLIIEKYLLIKLRQYDPKESTRKKAWSTHYKEEGRC